METKKIIGGVLAIAGVALFYASFTDSATGWLAEWISTYAPTVKDHYTPDQMLMAWGGMLAGIGTLLVCRKN